MYKAIRNLILLLGIVILWTICSNKLSPLFIPKPVIVLRDFAILLGNGLLLEYIAKSFTRITLATLLSILASIPLALTLIRYKWLDELLTPLTNTLRYLPITAFYPLLILWIGIDENMKIAFLFLATFLYFLPSILLNVKEVDKTLIEEGRVSGMTEWQVIRYIILPCSMPSICQSILVMYGIGWTYITIAETINANSGLGFIINTSSSRGRTDLVFVAILTISLISYIVDNTGNYLIKKAFKWKFE